MKKEIIFLLLLMVIGGSWLFSCHKDPGGPTKKDPCPWPEITTEGLNTFGCKINGKEWVPCVDLYGLAATLRPIDCLVTESDGSNSLSISVTRSVIDSTYSDVSFNGQMFIGYRPCREGLFHIPVDFFHASTELFTDWEGNSYEEFDTIAENYINVLRLDTATNMISAQFQITLIDKQTGKKVEITEGRFDLKYYQQ